MTEQQRGITFPARPDGQRSTSALGRDVVSAALRPVDPPGALAAEQETTWRSGYLTHFRRAVVAGVASPTDWLTIARTGLETLHDQMQLIDDGGGEVPATAALTAPASRELTTVAVRGSGAPTGLALPYRGELLRGDAIRQQVATWVGAGVVEPSVAAAIDEVVDHPEWLRLDGWTVAVLGAGSEMGPTSNLLAWGATVAGVDLPRPEIWRRLVATARAGAGTLLVPTTSSDRSEDDAAVAAHAGADLITDFAAVAEWLGGVDGRLLLGNYVYADGGLHVRLSTAVDVLTLRLQRQRDDVALGFLATPTDVFVVPREVVDHASTTYASRTRASKLLGRPLRTVSRGRLLQRTYLPDADPGICDVLVPQQGPNYALAKRVQRWRAAVARDAGTQVAFHVAPSTRTRSVTKNRALAAAFAGAHRFGIEVFEPATSNTLMAALLVHDLQTAPAPHAHPWQDEAHEAAHGGLWRAAYAPRSTLGLAALLGYASRG